MACCLLHNFLIDERQVDENDDAELLQDYESDLLGPASEEQVAAGDANVQATTAAKARLKKQTEDFIRLNQIIL